MIVDHLSHWREYYQGEIWKKAFEFLEALKPDAEDAMHTLIENELTARVMSYQTKSPDDAVLEAHRKFIDIQMLLDGEEIIGWYRQETLNVKTPYNEIKDVEFYYPPQEPATQILLTPKVFTVLYPQDAHQPQLRAATEAQPVKKVVLKVAVQRMQK